MHKALFLDRDGVINIDYGYVCTPERFQLVDGIIELLHIFQNKGYLLVIVTNQAGIAKGLYSEAQFLSFDGWMRSHFEQLGVNLEATYYCPYHKLGTVLEYCKDSHDRKPNPGMFLRAIKDLNISAGDSIMIGDNETDMEAAYRANIATRIHLTSSRVSDYATNGTTTIYSLITSFNSIAPLD